MVSKKNAPPFTFVTASEHTKHLHRDADLFELLKSGGAERLAAELPAFTRSILHFNPIYLLGNTAFHVLVWGLQESVEKKPEYTLGPSDLEALQALLLPFVPRSDCEFSLPADVSELWTSIKNHHFAVIEKESLDFLGEERATLAGAVRLHSAYYRNPYGRQFVEEMMNSIANSFDARYDGRRRISTFFKLIFLMLDEIDRRFEATRERMHIVIGGSRDDVLRLSEELSNVTELSRWVYGRIAWSDLTLDTLRPACHNLLELCSYAFTWMLPGMNHCARSSGARMSRTVTGRPFSSHFCRVATSTCSMCWVSGRKPASALPAPCNSIQSII